MQVLREQIALALAAHRSALQADDLRLQAAMLEYRQGCLSTGMLKAA